MDDGTQASSEPVWSYRGYQLKPSEFTTAMVHFYRGEVQRANVWRQRLDNTTNWAVLTTGAAITFALGSQAGHHGVILLNTLLITLFLFLEARRYRYYELFASRVRLMETDFFATMLVPPFAPSADWAESLAENLLHPQFTVSLWEALGRRFRQNYLWIYVVLAIAWVLKSVLFPTPVTSWAEFIQRAALGTIPGEVMLLVGIVFNGLLLLIGIATLGLKHATGEVLPRYTALGLTHSLSSLFEHDKNQEASDRRPWFRYTRKRPQAVALIVSQHNDKVGKAILVEMKRGATRLDGVGLYTGQSQPVLMTALTLTEINHLKALVSQADPNAFVIVMPAQEVLGRGFQPLPQKQAAAQP